MTLVLRQAKLRAMTGPTLLETYLRTTGKKQKELAEAAGLLPDQVSRFLSGRRVPSVESAVALDRATDGAVPVTAWANRKGKRKAS